MGRPPADSVGSELKVITWLATAPFGTLLVRFRVDWILLTISLIAPLVEGWKVEALPP